MNRGQRNGEGVTLARTLGYFEATMIGVGAMIGAGIFVLTGIAAGEAGPAALIAFALNGVVTLFTAFSYAELASAIPEAGGGYSFVQRAMPEWLGYLAGWMLWFAYTVACSLYALGFSGYFLEFLAKYLPTWHEALVGLAGKGPAQAGITLAVSLFFLALNVLGTNITGKAENVVTMAKIAVLSIFVAFGLRQVLAFPQQAAASFVPLFPKGLGGVLVAMGLTFIAFEGYDLIATVSEEVTDPKRNIPRAIFSSLGIAVVIYLFVVFVSLGAINPGGMPAWQFLGQFQETAVVKAAENFMPWFGVALIVAGGLFSTMSALNATILASSRVAFSMGRDRMLPPIFSTVHAMHRTPHVAILVTGAILLLLATTVPIVVVGSAASLLFLLSFALVNAATLVLRRREPEIERGYKIPLYPLPPILGIVSCLGLGFYQFTFQPLAWFISLAWIGLGLVVYVTYASQIEEREELEAYRIIHEEIVAVKEYSVLIPVATERQAHLLGILGSAIAKDRDGEVFALHVVQVPMQLSIYEGRRFLKEARPVFDEVIRQAKELDVPVRTMIRIGRHVGKAIVDTARKRDANLILLSWPGYTRSEQAAFGRVIDYVAQNPPCDMAVIRFREREELKSILVPTAGGPNAELAMEMAVSQARQYEHQYGQRVGITALYVCPPRPDPVVVHMGRAAIAGTIADFNFPIEIKMISAPDVVTGILREAEKHNLVVMGASQERLFERLVFGTVPERVARQCPKTTIVVKRYQGPVISWLKRVLTQ
ncbi:MAG: amino acid permease [Anaerolineae bacterium]